MANLILRMALPVPLHRHYDYLPPAGVAPDQLHPGQRLLVPFGNGKRVGVLVRLVGESDVPAGKLKAALQLLDPDPLYGDRQLEFLCWLADYYHHPSGEVLAAAMPVGLRKGKSLQQVQQKGWQLSKEALKLAPDSLRRAPRQAQILGLLQKTGGQTSAEYLRNQLGQVGSVLRTMRDKGLLVACELEVQQKRQNFSEPLLLNKEQKTAVEQVQASFGKFAAYLLDGVTSSGKTEVYLQLVAEVLAQGKSSLVLVPEISLTPQLIARFQKRLPCSLAVLHSGLKGSERQINWQRARSGEARVIIGTRSAVLASIPDLGLVVVDEEHDASFKQQEGFRYSARDMAVVRARRDDCPVVLGSATPSLESLHNVAEGKYVHLKLKQRAAGAGAPCMELVDVRDQKLQGGMSVVLMKALEKTLAQGQQAIVFLNRRGFAPVLTCYSCGWLSDCPRCDAKQTLHSAKRLLQCHHCGSQQRLPVNCPECGSTQLNPLGQGTEQLEQVLSARFADYPLLRIDRDTTRRKGSLNKLLQQAREGKAALLVGTQMLAKGHHFPGVSLVGILDVDGGFFGADFRAAERMAQMIVQVAGRAGRGDQPGRVLIQTRFPEHPMLQNLLHHGYGVFAQGALAERKMAELPPVSYQALLRASAHKAEHAHQFLEQVHRLLQRESTKDISLWGPVPAPMQRRAGQYRAHLLIQSAQRQPLHSLLRQMIQDVQDLPGVRRVRWSLDVDPQDLY